MIEKDITMEKKAAEMGLELAYIANDAHTAMQASDKAADVLWAANDSSHTRDLLTDAHNKASHSVSLAGIAYHCYKNAAAELIGRHMIGEKVIEESINSTTQTADPLVSLG